MKLLLNWKEGIFQTATGRSLWDEIPPDATPRDRSKASYVYIDHLKMCFLDA